MIWVAHEVLRSGASVVLDFGCWSPQERWAIRVIAESTGAAFVLEYLAVDERTRRDRATSRWAEAPESTFAMSEADHDFYLTQFVPPTRAELDLGPVPPPPAPHPTWFASASARWPTLPDLAASSD